MPSQPAFCTSVRSKVTVWPAVPVETPVPFTTTLGAALVLATALVTSAVAAVPVSLPVLAGEALAEAVELVADALALDEPVVVVAAGVPELLAELHAVAAAASAAARRTAGTARPRPASRLALPAGNHAGTMRDPPIAFKYRTRHSIYIQ